MTTKRRDGFYQINVGDRIFQAQKRADGRWDLLAWDYDAPRDERLLATTDTLREAKEEAAELA